MEVRSHRHHVVFHDINHRQLPERSHVEGFMESALIHRAVAEVADANAIFLAVLARERNARRQRQMAADDRVAAEESLLDVEEVHGAPLPLRAARRLPHLFAHRGPGLHAASEGVAVIAIGGDHIVVFSENADRTDRNRLLSAIEVTETADFLILVKHGRPLFKAADQQHLPEPSQSLISRDLRLGLGLRLRHRVRLLNGSKAGPRPARIRAGTRTSSLGQAGIF